VGESSLTPTRANCSEAVQFVGSLFDEIVTGTLDAARVATVGPTAL
jgi:hypothetical protein